MSKLFVRMKNICIISIFGFFLGCTAVEEPKLFNSNIDKYAYTKKYIDWYIEETMNTHNIVGLSVAMVDDQELVYAKGFGYSNRSKKIKATANTIYRAGSLSKTFTSMAIMKLSIENKIDIDAPINKYLLSFKFKNYPKDTKKVTIRTIMTHHAGIPNISSAYELSNNELNYNEVLKQILLKRLKNHYKLKII